MSHKTLVSSAAVAAICAAIPAANAQTTVFDNVGAFDAAVAGQAMVWSEDFESYEPAYGYSMLPSPIAGLGDGSVTMSSNDNVIFAFKGNYYYANMTSTTMGVLEGRIGTLNFDDGVDSVGMEFYGTDSFTAAAFDELWYTVYDMGGGVLAQGNYAATGASSGYMGITSDTLIGRVDFSASVFGSVGAALYADNVRGFAVPTPASAALLGLGGFVATRRRR